MMRVTTESTVVKSRDADMGKVTTEMTVMNNRDEILSDEKMIGPEEVRTVHLTNVLVDTGATTLCLPKRYVEQLGLSDKRTVAVATANGVTDRSIYQNVKIQIGGREAIVECIELPDEAEPLLGVIPLEMMGIELDLQKQQIKFLPYDTLNTYITVY